MSRRRIAAILVLISSLSVLDAIAQERRGEGNVTVTYQRGHTHGQRNSIGEVIYPDSTDTHALTWDVDFGLSDRLAVDASLPLMAVRFAGGPNPHPVGISGQPSTLDDGTYHGSFQDFHVGARFSVVQSRRLTVTPFAEVIVPSHRYESLGQSVVGRDLHALVIGATIGGFSDALLPGLYFQTQVSHAVVQQVLGIRPDRTGADGEVGYFVTPRFAVRFIETFQFIHDGIDFVGSRPTFAIHSNSTASTTHEHFLNHDRLLRSNVLNLGGGFSIGASKSVDIFVIAVKTAWGENVQGDRAVTIGANWHFRMRGPTVQHNPQHSGQRPSVY